MRKLLINRLLDGQKENSGQALILVAIVLFTLVCLIAFTVNVGHRITGKVEMQNAADSAVLTNAIWYARGLNTISILNVGMTECLAMAIMFKAFNQTYKVAKILVELQYQVCSFASLTPLGAAYCLGVASARNVIMPKFIKYISESMEKLSREHDGALWGAMRFLQGVEEGVKRATPYVAFYDASEIADKNGAEKWITIHPKLPIGNVLLWPLEGLIKGLPVVEGSFKDLCEPTKGSGGRIYDSDYLNWNSWLKGDDFNALGMGIKFFKGNVALRSAFFTIWAAVLAPPGVWGVGYSVWVDVTADTICPDGNSPPKDYYVTRISTSCDECTPANNATNIEILHSEPQEMTSYSCDDADFGSNYLSSGYKLKKTGSFIAAKKISDDPCKICELRKDKYEKKTCTTDAQGNQSCKTDTGYKYYRRIKSKTCRFSEKANPDEVKINPDGSIKPMILDGKWNEKLTFTACVRKDVETKVVKIGLKLSEKYAYAVAQSEVYNEIPDLFNQNFKARLIPCKLNISLLPDAINDVLKNVGEEVLVH